MEALVVALWLFPDFLLASLSLLAAHRCLRLLPGAAPAGGGEEPAVPAAGRWMIWPGGAAAVTAGLLLAPTGSALTLWSERIVPAGQYLAAGLFLIIYMVGTVKKRL